VTFQQYCSTQSAIASDITLFNFFFFFFQAEDGIRDLIVTGVQTCALPISNHVLQPLQPRHRRFGETIVCSTWFASCWDGRTISRSEERRVGKECRYRWGRYQ